MEQPNRDTYLSNAQILERVDDYLDAAQQALETRASQSGVSERVSMLLDALLPQQVQLREGIERFRDDAPKSFLSTFSQYTLPLPERVPELPEPLDSDGLTRWIMAVNERLSDFLKELAEKAEDPDMGELYAGLEDQVRGQNQRIARETNRFRDL